MKFEIRKATLEDTVGIARVHVNSWLETYQGIMPQSKLDALTITGSTKIWESNIANDNLLFVALVDKEIVGFVVGGENRIYQECETNEANKCDCEMSCLYLLKKYQRYGIGKSLFETIVIELRELKYKQMAVWVAEKNKTKNFYIKMGATLIDRRKLKINQQDIPLLAYSYDITEN